MLRVAIATNCKGYVARGNMFVVLRHLRVPLQLVQVVTLLQNKLPAREEFSHRHCLSLSTVASSFSCGDAAFSNFGVRYRTRGRKWPQFVEIPRDVRIVSCFLPQPLNIENTGRYTGTRFSGTRLVFVLNAFCRPSLRIQNIYPSGL